MSEPTLTTTCIGSTETATADADADRNHSNNRTSKKRRPKSSANKRSSSRSNRKKKQRQAALEEERLLAASLFGGGATNAAGAGDDDDHDDDDDGAARHQTTTTLAQRSKQKKKRTVQKKEKQQSATKAEADEFTFEIDRAGDSSVKVDEAPHSQDEDEDEDASQSTSSDSVADERQREASGGAPPAAVSSVGGAAWVDQDDDDDTRTCNDDKNITSNEINLMKGSSRLRKLRRSKADADPLSGQELEQRLRERFQSTTQTTARTDWANVDKAANEDAKAKLDSDTDEGEKDDWFVSASAPLLAQQRRLAPHTLQAKRCPDANQTDPNQAVVQAVGFHPASAPDRPLLLTAGLDKSLRFFQVSEEKSEKIHGIHFPKLPIFSASFLGTTGNVLVSGRRSFFYLYDSVAGNLEYIPRILGRQEKSWEYSTVSPDGRTAAFGGNDGYVVLWDVQSRSWRADVKMNGSARAVVFTPDSHELLTSGSDGDVYRWDLRMNHKCLERFSNQDGTITSALAASTRTLAVGAESGVVNLYDEQHHQLQSQSQTSKRRSALALTHTTRDPRKTIMNLKTSADCLHFNSDGQMLVMSSRREKNNLRVVHVPTGTVFANWPTSKTPLGYVWSTAFSPGSRFLAIGNDKGKCLLYKMLHYDQEDDNEY